MEAMQDIFQTIKSRSLTRKASQLDDVFVKRFSGSLDIAVIEHIVDKLANQVGMIFHRQETLPAYRLFVIRSIEL
jgi:hypothetical protein